MRRREKRVKRGFGRRACEEFFDRIASTVLNLFYTHPLILSVLELRSTKVESFVLIELNRSADFRFAVAERGREFSSVVSQKFL